MKADAIRRRIDELLALEARLSAARLDTDELTREHRRMVRAERERLERALERELAPARHRDRWTQPLFEGSSLEEEEDNQTATTGQGRLTW